MRKIFSILFALALVLSFSLVVTTPVAAATLNVPSVAYPTIQAAVAAASPGDTIMVAAGTYVEVGQIVINKNLTIIGADKTTTIIKPNADTGNSGNGKGWWLVNQGIIFNLSGVTLDGTGYKIFHGIRDMGTGTIQNVHFTNIAYNAAGPDYAGFAIYAFGMVGAVNVSDCVFDNIGREGIAYWGAGTTGTYNNNTYTGNGLGNHMDYGVEVTNGAVVTITGSTITNCRGEVGGDPTSWTSAGIMVTGIGSKATITGNTITGNYWGIDVGLATGTDTPEGYAHGNDISGNYGLGARHGSAFGVFDARYNWWGDNSGPGGAGPGTGNNVSANVNYDSWTGKIGTSTGTGTASFTPSAGNLTGLSAVAESSLPAAARATKPINFPDGLFSFNITGLLNGATVNVTITLPPGAAPTQYWKYHAHEGGWVRIPMTIVGPPNVIIITLKDGGLGDDDLTANGVIVDQGGGGNLAVGWATYPINKVRVLLPWIALLAAIMAGVSLLVLRRRRTQS
jgi:hypothetical protein